MVMVEVGSVTFLDLVKQDQSSRESKRQARLQEQLATALEQFKANKKKAEDIGLEPALVGVANYLRSIHFVSANVALPVEPEVRPSRIDPTYTELLGTGNYELKLNWRQYALGIEYEIFTSVHGKECFVGTHHSYGKNVDAFRRTLELPKLESVKLHQVLFEAYKFAIYGPQFQEPT